MQYKGDDLDLRVSHTRSPRETYVHDYEPAPPNGRWPRARTGVPSSSEPLWVDEVLLACCNYAFDVAQANGAGEVDLEHLVNALTRVDAAARMLEARGVHEGQLRRESAALIASEIPAANAGDALAPRRSADLEDVLRRASDQAQRRGVSASVDDVLWVLLHYGRDLAVVQLMRRLTPDWQRAEWGRSRDFTSVEPAVRPGQLLAADGITTRVAGMEDALRLMHAEFAAERKGLLELVRDIQRDVVAQRGDGAAFRNDLGQRLEGLERTVQARGDGGRMSQHIADRLGHLEKSLQVSLGETTRGAMQLVQRVAALEMTLDSGRGTPSLQPLADRLSTLEKAVHGGMGEGARNWAHLGNRLASLEASLADSKGNSGHLAVTDRIGALERAIDTGLTQRFGAIERLVGEVRSARMPDEIASRLATIEKRLDEPAAVAVSQSQVIKAEFDSLRRVVEQLAAEGNRARLETAERLQAIDEMLARPAAGFAGLPAEFPERLGGLERAVRSGFGDAAATTAHLVERLDLLQTAIAARSPDDGEAMLILDDRLGSMERALETRGEQAASATHEIVERLRILEQRPSGTGSVDIGALMAPLSARLDGLDGAALQGCFVEVLARIEQLEQRMRADAAATEEALRGRDQDFDFIYGEIKQLGQSQATLNSAVSDWRTESQEHFGTLAIRLDRLQQTGAVGELPADTASMEFPGVVGKARNGAALPAGATQSAVVDTSVRPGAVSGAPTQPARYAPSLEAADYALPPQPGRGFWYWLYGTDSVTRANRENILQVSRMRQNIRDARERRRNDA